MWASWVDQPVTSDCSDVLVAGIPGDAVDPALVFGENLDLLVLGGVEHDGRVVRRTGDQKSGARRPKIQTSSSNQPVKTALQAQ